MSAAPSYDSSDQANVEFARVAWNSAEVIDRIMMLYFHLEAFGKIPSPVWASLPDLAFDDLPATVQHGLTKFCFVARRILNGARAALRAAT